jgi:hypothetical protein
MKVTFTRRVTAIAGIVAVFAIIATAAFAATLSNNTSTLPSANPTDLKASNAKAWAMQFAAKDYIGLTATKTMTWGNATTTGGGNLTISKQSGDNITITITSMDSGLIIPNAMVTVSGGQTGATRITSTTLSSNQMKYTIKLYSHEGTPPQLNIKWYTEQLMM